LNYHVYQQVTLRDFNNELLTETYYYHGEFSLPLVSPGVSFVVPTLGLKEFEVVIDPRIEPKKYIIHDIEINLVESQGITKVYLEPITLIIGQHDVGSLV
jgi:hypothetical protein